MSLTSSLFTGTSGLTNLGNAMQVIGDNIANVNTVGFKGNRYTFSDLLSQSVATQSGTAQVGRGMALGSVDSSFEQGSFESTGNTTDLSIGGDGFFVVSEPGVDREYYTRAGNFNFDKTGALVNPEGYILQGWVLDPDTGDDLGAVTDIILDSFTSAPKETEKIQTITNLDADAISQTSVLGNVWDATEDVPMGATNYEYQTVVTAYDALGSTHDLTIYYDKKDNSEWEYLITCNPEEDMRNLVQGTVAQGILARGVITFSDSSGTISNVTMDEFTGLVSNVQTNGSISTDNTHFTIENYEVFTQDYYDIGLEYDGSTWSFSNYFRRLDPPFNNATITGDANQVLINFDNDTAGVNDLVITFDAPAQPFDSLTFDLNDPNRIQVQGVTNTVYNNETANENTTLKIINPEVITDDALGTFGGNLVWNASARTPFWSWGEIHTMSNFTAGVASTSTKFNVTNEAALIDTTGNMTLNWDGTGLGGDGGWTLAGDPAGYASAAIVAGSGSRSAVTVRLTNAAGETTDIEYTFDPELDDTGVPTAAGSFEFGTQATDRPVGYMPDPLSVYGLTGMNDGDVTYTLAQDNLVDETGLTMTWDGANWTLGNVGQYTGAGTGVVAGATDSSVTINLETAAGEVSTMTFAISPPANATDGFTFSTIQRSPDAYANAALTGDRDKVMIDLDNDGNDDIQFDFTEPLKSGAGVANSSIQFDLEGCTAWTAQSTNVNGYFDFSADFLGADAGKTEMDIEFDIGTKDDGTGKFINDSLSSTQYARASSTIFQDADGYGAGDLQGVDVAADGVMTGIYSNGELIPLYRVALAKFLNNQGLFKEGGNLYRETRDSGTAITNRPGSNGLGSLSPNSLEMSNVDIAGEFVDMITAQRGFQANSKIVTTVDEMLAEVIQMKR